MRAAPVLNQPSVLDALLVLAQVPTPEALLGLVRPGTDRTDGSQITQLFTEHGLDVGPGEFRVGQRHRFRDAVQTIWSHDDKFADNEAGATHHQRLLRQPVVIVIRPRDIED